MEAADHRQLVTQLAEDLSWLEDHCRRQADLAQHAGQLRLATGLVRDILGPYLNGQAPTPLHIAVVGGAGAGKSTIVNFLCGSVVAEANPQAGYTRHPTAYIAGGSSFPWPAHLGFLGPLQRLSQPAPANLDEDVYQVKRVSLPPESGNGFGGARRGRHLGLSRYDDLGSDRVRFPAHGDFRPGRCHRLCRLR